LILAATSPRLDLTAFSLALVWNSEWLSHSEIYAFHTAWQIAEDARKYLDATGAQRGVFAHILSSVCWPLRLPVDLAPWAESLMLDIPSDWQPDPPVTHRREDKVFFEHAFVNETNNLTVSRTL